MFIVAPSGNLIMVYMNGGLLKMGLFSKRKKTPPTPTPPKILTPCERGDHLYRDFPPVIYYTNRPGDCYIAVRETYVCVMCGDKREVTLEKQTWDHQPSDKLFEKALEEMQNKYKGWAQPIARVNDMIQDAIYVDRERLRIWEMLHKPDKQEENAVKYTLQLLERDKNEMDTGKMGDK
jgi:hypothetical protein